MSALLDERCPAAPRRMRPADIRELARRANSLHAAVHRTAAGRRADEAAWAAWEAAVNAWHAYDHEALWLWHPSVLAAVRDHEGGWREVALTFLEVDPWFFRSGYLKARLCRALKQALLTEDERGRVRRLLLAVLESRHREEFRHFVRLALRVADAAFADAVRGLASGPDPGVRCRAHWMATALARHAAFKAPPPLPCASSSPC